MEEHAIEGSYSIIDVSKVINYALKNQFKSTENLSENAHENALESVTIQEKQKVYKGKSTVPKQEANKDIIGG